jgi:hypothetical protein
MYGMEDVVLLDSIFHGRSGAAPMKDNIISLL